MTNMRYGTDRYLIAGVHQNHNLVESSAVLRALAAALFRAGKCPFKKACVSGLIREGVGREILSYSDHCGVGVQ